MDTIEIVCIVMFFSAGLVFRIIGDMSLTGILRYIKENHKEFWRNNGSPEYSFFTRTKIIWLHPDQFPKDKKLQEMIFKYKFAKYAALGFLLLALIILLIV